MSSLKETYSFSGSDARVYAYFKNDVRVRLESVHTISLSVYEAKGRVRSLGFKTVRGFTRAVREIAGTMIMLVTNDHPLAGLMKINNAANSNLYGRGSKASWSFDAETTALGARWKIDPLENYMSLSNTKMRAPSTLPPFNILLEYRTEVPKLDDTGKSTGQPLYMAAMEIIDMEILGEGIVTSVNDLVTEVQYQFVARDFRELSSGELGENQQIKPPNTDLDEADTTTTISFGTGSGSAFANAILSSIATAKEKVAVATRNVITSVSEAFEGGDQSPTSKPKPADEIPIAPTKGEEEVIPENQVDEEVVETLETDAESTSTKANESRTKAEMYEERRVAAQGKADGREEAQEELLTSNPGFDPNDPNADPDLLREYNNLEKVKKRYEEDAALNAKFRDTALTKEAELRGESVVLNEALASANAQLDQQAASNAVKEAAASPEVIPEGTIIVSKDETLSSMKEFESFSKNDGKTREFDFSEEQTRWADMSDMTGTPIQTDFANEVDRIETTNLGLNGSGQNVYVALDSAGNPISPPTNIPGSVQNADESITVNDIITGSGQDQVIKIEGDLGSFNYSDGVELVSSAAFANENKEIIQKTQTSYPMLGENGEDLRIAEQAETYQDYVDALGGSGAVLESAEQFNNFKQGGAYYPAFDTMSEKNIAVTGANGDVYQIKQELAVSTQASIGGGKYPVFVNTSIKKENDSNYTLITTAAHTSAGTTVIAGETDTYSFGRLLEAYNDLTSQ